MTALAIITIAAFAGWRFVHYAATYRERELDQWVRDQAVQRALEAQSERERVAREFAIANDTAIFEAIRRRAAQ